MNPTEIQSATLKNEPPPSVRKPGLRWFQFSLRSLLGFVLLCSLALAWWRWHAVGVPDQFNPVKEELRDSARQAYEIAMSGYCVGTVVEDDVYHWSQAWMESEREVSKTRQQEIQAIRDHIERTRMLCNYTNGRSSLAKVAYWLTEAELLLAQIDSRERTRCVQASYDRRQLQGVWKTKSQTVGSKSVNEWKFDTVTVKDRIADVASSSGESSGILTLDPVSTPQTFEICARNGCLMYDCAGSYQLDGDRWTLTLANNTVISLEKQKRGSSPK
jgi:uncharacterized protein (TIGR03067 family)